MRFSSGDRVRTRRDNPSGHTRIPAYLRGRIGYVERVQGSFPFADERAAGLIGAVAVPLYTIRFEAGEIWGADAPGGTAVCADLFERYLEEA
jgi:nitrile hydratase